MILPDMGHLLLVVSYRRQLFFLETPLAINSVGSSNLYNNMWLTIVKYCKTKQTNKTIMYLYIYIYQYTLEIRNDSWKSTVKVPFC